MNKAGSADPTKIALALEGLDQKDFLGYDTMMRKDDHQFISEYFVGVLHQGREVRRREAPASAGRPTSTILAKDLDQPTTCKMKRPTSNADAAAQRLPAADGRAECVRPIRWAGSWKSFSSRC